MLYANNTYILHLLVGLVELGKLHPERVRPARGQLGADRLHRLCEGVDDLWGVGRALERGLERA